MHMNLKEFRKSPDDREWELPAWGHPISQGVMPLFVSVHGRLLPVGTAFTTGKKVQFLVTATHNIDQLVKKDPRFARMIGKGRLEGSHDLSVGYGLYALHHRAEGDKGQMTLWPVQKIDGATPTDVVFAHPKFTAGMQTLVSPLSFDIPAVGETVLSVGYADFFYPEDGIDMDLVRSGTFDWHANYRHRLFVVEGTVQRIFTQRFASGYVAGPCFAFSPEIRHGMSGGPVYNTSGDVCGVNSAGASTYFNEPMSLGSLLYPMLTRPLRFSAELGPLTLNATHSVLDLISQGTLVTDGSELHVAYTKDKQTGIVTAHPRGPIANQGCTHDDFLAFQQGKGASKLTGDYMVAQRRKRKRDE